jgi:hypothetical protein
MAVMIGMLVGGAAGFFWGYFGGGDDWKDSAVYTAVLLAFFGSIAGMIVTVLRKRKT